MPLNLGTAVNYGVLGGTGVTSTAGTVINGDLGAGPGGLIVGFPLGVDHGTTHAGDSQAVQAQADFAQAYSAAAGRTPSASIRGDQNGAILDAGVYSAAAAISLTGTMTLDGQNDPNAVFIFQVNAALSTAASSTIHLINGAQASNVFWQVNGAATTGASSSFSGTIMAIGAITLGAGASLDGGALSDGLVTLADNTISAPDAVTFISPPTPTSALTSTTTDTVFATGAPSDTGAITYTSLTASVCAVGSTSGALTYVASGTCTIEATQAADVIDGDGSRTNNTSIRVSLPTMPLNLGTAVNYGVLGGTGVTSTAGTVINGDLGAGPGGLIVGFPLGVDHGTTHAGDSQAVQAQADFAQAYSAAAGRTPSASIRGDQNGAILDAGVYSAAAAISLTGTMTLDGQNDPNAVFIFQVNAALSTAASSTIHLINGAQASNVFWQVNGAATTGASSSFSGTIMAIGAITLGAGASLDGGALSDGLVTLADNTISAPDAVTFISPPTPTSALTSTTTDTVFATGAPSDTGAITYTSLTASVCAVGSTSGALTYVASGTCTIEATQAADVIDGDGSAASETNITVSVPISHSVTFNGNGSTGGLMAPETDFAPTPLSANAFSRTGYVFARWNSAADGSGTAYADGASDPFTANQTLFAQWTINASYSVTFNGNGSTGGLMAPETDFAPTPLSANAFSRTGYVFARWNSAADGSGTAYADGASDPFTANQTLFAQWTINATNPAPPTVVPTAPTSPPGAAAKGYYLVGSDGGIFTFGGAQFYGSTGSLKLQRPVVGITATVSEGGYWLVASDGGIFSFGDAGFYGSIPGLGLAPAGTVGGKHLNAPIVGMVPSFDGGGYFMVASDGGVFAFGDAAFEGSCPGIGGCGGAAVAVAPDSSGRGYWLITASGNIYTFGNASYFGAPGPQSSPVTSMVRTTDGLGYWVLLANGSVYAYGDAVDRGSPLGSVAAANSASAIFTTSDGGGYWVASANGEVFTYGDAPYDGGMSGTRLNGSIIAATGF